MKERKIVEIRGPGGYPWEQGTVDLEPGSSPEELLIALSGDRRFSVTLRQRGEQREILAIAGFAPPGGWQWVIERRNSESHSLTGLTPEPGVAIGSVVVWVCDDGLDG